MDNKWIDIEKDGLPSIWEGNDDLYIICDMNSGWSQKMSFAKYDPFISVEPGVVWVSDTLGITKATHYMLAPKLPLDK